MLGNSLRPIETLKKHEREALFAAARAAVTSHHYVAQTTRLLKKERAERDVDEELRNKRVEIDQRLSQIDSEVTNFEDSQFEMQKKLEGRRSNFDAYDRKIHIEQEKLKKEEELIRLKLDEISDLNAKLEVVTQHNQEVQHKIEQYEVFREFLNQVVHRSDDYEDIEQLMSRYFTLKENNEHLNLQLEVAQQALQAEKEDFTSTLKRYKDEIAVNTGKLHRMERKIEALNTHLQQTESATEERRRQMILSKGETGQLTLTIQNLYEKVLGSRLFKIGESEEAKELNPYTNMLNEIEERISELRDITSDIPDDFVNRKSKAEQVAKQLAAGQPVTSQLKYSPAKRHQGETNRTQSSYKEEHSRITKAQSMSQSYSANPNA
jgi:chromosome segregation ATPase